MNNDFEFKENNNSSSRIKAGFKDDFSKADLRAYKDPEGMSVAKLDLGLWYVENKDNIVLSSYFALLLFASLSTVYFLYEYISYAVKGMPAERAYAAEIASRTLPDHSFYQSRKPLDLQLYPVKSVSGTGDKTDLISQISNPNKDYWVRFKYYFLDNGEKIGWEDGFALPGETKHLVLLGQELSKSLGGLRLAIDNVTWGRINRHDFGDWEKYYNNHLDFKFSNIDFLSSEKSLLSEKIPINVVSFYVENRTSYNYWNVPLTILLYNYSDLASVVTYEINDFESSEKRDISFTLPGSMKKISEVKIVPNLDITRKDLYKSQKAEQGFFR